MTTLPPINLGQPATLDLTAYRGDTGRFRVHVTEDGALLDVSDATWDADIRDHPDAPVLGSMTVTPVAGDLGAVDVVMPAGVSPTASATGEAVWDLEMTLPDPDGRVITLLRGKITLIADVSRPSVAPPPQPTGAGAVPVPSSGPVAPLGDGTTPARLGGPDVAPVPASESFAVQP